MTQDRLGELNGLEYDLEEILTQLKDLKGKYYKGIEHDYNNIIKEHNSAVVVDNDLYELDSVDENIEESEFKETLESAIKQVDEEHDYTLEVLENFTSI